MMTCVIIEDLKVASDYLAKCCKKSGLVEVLHQFPDVATALEFLDTHTADLLFLDVEMPGATGFELLDNLSFKPKVILTTSKEEYAYNAFQYHVQDFLKKPFTYQRFLEAVEKIKGSQPLETGKPKHDYLFIKTENKLVRLNFDDILFVESMGDYVRFVTGDKKYISHNTIGGVNEKLSGSHFMKVHRSYIINLEKIDDIRENDLYINGIEIPISRNLKSEVIKKLTIL